MTALFSRAPREAVTAEMIAAVEAAGLKPFMRNANDTWLMFTDGTRIGCLTNDRLEGWKLGTVHIPNRVSGTGFALGPVSDLSPETLVFAFAHAPSWAGSRDHESVRKWKSWDAYREQSSFDRAYVEVHTLSPEQVELFAVNTGELYALHKDLARRNADAAEWAFHIKTRVFPHYRKDCHAVPVMAPADLDTAATSLRAYYAAHIAECDA